MIINKIVKLKNNKYKIYIDDTIIITFDNVILENNLLYKKTIDNIMYDKILADTKYYESYNKVVQFLLKKRRSEKETYLYIDKFELTLENKIRILDKLKSINLINDREYCKAYINDKMYLSKQGVNKIKSDLLKENIDLNIIEEELSIVDKTVFKKRLEKLIIKKINTNKKYSNTYLKQKVLQDMINLGYEKEVVEEILNSNILCDKNILNSEFNKIYNKLKLKYNGLDLKVKVKQKLVQKGFKLEDINLLLDKKTEE